MLEKPLYIDPKDPPLEDPLAKLEKSFIEAFLATKGYSIKDLESLPKQTSKKLMTEASMYASNKLAEVETRSRLVHDLHGEE